MFEALHSLRPARAQLGPSIPQPLQGSASTRVVAQMPPDPSPPVTLQPVGFVLKYLWLPCTVCHLSLVSSRANYNY